VNDIKECRITFAIYPDNIHPDEITSRLGITPTERNILGEQRINSIGQIRIINVAGWFLSSDNIVQSRDMRDHLDWILGKVSPTKEAIILLQSMPQVQMRIRCVSCARKYHNAQTLSVKHAQILADLNLEFDFDYYFNHFFDMS
jgi:hypothetical protein